MIVCQKEEDLQVLQPASHLSQRPPARPKSNTGSDACSRESKIEDKVHLSQNCCDIVGYLFIPLAIVRKRLQVLRQTVHESVDPAASPKDAQRRLVHGEDDIRQLQDLPLQRQRAFTEAFGTDCSGKTGLAFHLVKQSQHGRIAENAVQQGL